jgi:hypothetical protein
MASANYIGMKLAVAAGGESDEKFSPVVVRVPGRCDHVTTVCTDCIDTWALDYDLRVPVGQRAKFGFRPDVYVIPSSFPIPTNLDPYKIGA